MLVSVCAYYSLFKIYRLLLIKYVSTAFLRFLLLLARCSSSEQSPASNGAGTFKEKVAETQTQ